jgi:hypothetical protein
MAANLDGSDETTLIPASVNPNGALGVAVSGGHLYWTKEGDIFGDADGAIMEANLDGSDVTTVVSGLYSPCAVAVGPQ